MYLPPPPHFHSVLSVIMHQFSHHKFARRTGCGDLRGPSVALRTGLPSCTPGASSAEGRPLGLCTLLPCFPACLAVPLRERGLLGLCTGHSVQRAVWSAHCIWLELSEALGGCRGENAPENWGGQRSSASQTSRVLLVRVQCLWAHRKDAGVRVGQARSA